jgi:GT2 family glycosyltransferase
MRLAFAEALKENFDYYLWLNDDSMFFPRAVRTMLDTSRSLKKKIGQDAIVVGSLHDVQSGVLTYGGRKIHSRWRPMSFLPVEPSDKPEPCDVINGNCVLLPRDIAKVTGNLSADFTHGAGDYDYSLRAKEQGFSSWIAPGYVGTCSRNYSLRGSCKDNAISIKESADKLSSPTGLQRIQDWMLFTRRYGGILWPTYWLRIFFRMNFPRVWFSLHSTKF